jgi:hypothetical protein
MARAVSGHVDEAKFREVYLAGKLKVWEIAIAYGCDVKTIRRMAKRLGLPSRNVVVPKKYPAPCSRCGTMTALDGFAKLGAGYRRSVCKACHSIETARHARTRKERGAVAVHAAFGTERGLHTPEDIWQQQNTPLILRTLRAFAGASA